MANIKTRTTQLIGNTPLLELTNIERVYDLKAKIFAKLEYFNLSGSVKDRAALYMVEQAEKEGKLEPGSTIIEPTSGNTGIGLAAVGKAKGYPVILVMPDTMSIERRRLMAAYGAKVVLTPGSQGMKGAIAKANELAQSTPMAFIPSQFENHNNALAHYETTGPEIYRDTDGQVDIFVAGVGTGGTVSGVGRYLKEKSCKIQVVAVEPVESSVLSGEPSGPHKIQGIGAGFIPEIYDHSVVDAIVRVSSEEAFAMGRQIGNTEGVAVGISSGAALQAALKLAQQEENYGKNIVVLFPDSGDRYLSTALFADE